MNRGKHIRTPVALALGAAALLFAWSPRPAQAQFGIGIGYPGFPFLYYNIPSVASPTEYLYDRDRQRIAQFGNAAQQQASASAMAGSAANSNAYFNRLRDFSGESTYHVASRQSVGQRATLPRREAASRGAVATAPGRPEALSIDAYFLTDGTIDWPRDAPDAGTLGSARAEVEQAVKIVRAQVQSRGRATVQSIGEAKQRLVHYGQPALAEVRSARSGAVADVFHYFLLFLHQSLDHAAGAEGP